MPVTMMLTETAYSMHQTTVHSWRIPRRAIKTTMERAMPVMIPMLTASRMWWTIVCTTAIQTRRILIMTGLVMPVTAIVTTTVFVMLPDQSWATIRARQPVGAPEAITA